MPKELIWDSFPCLIGDGVYVKRVYKVKSKELKTTFGGNRHISGTDRKRGPNVNLLKIYYATPFLQVCLYCLGDCRGL